MTGHGERNGLLEASCPGVSGFTKGKLIIMENVDHIPGLRIETVNLVSRAENPPAGLAGELTTRAPGSVQRQQDRPILKPEGRGGSQCWHQFCLRMVRR